MARLKFPRPHPLSRGGAAVPENTDGSWTKYSTSPIYKIKVFLVNYQETYFSLSVGVAVFH